MILIFTISLYPLIDHLSIILILIIINHLIFNPTIFFPEKITLLFIIVSLQLYSHPPLFPFSFVLHPIPFPLYPPPPFLLSIKRSRAQQYYHILYLARNRLTVVNCSSIMSSLLVTDHITITHPPNTPCVSLALNNHVAASHLHYYKITLSPLPLHRSTTNFILSIVVAPYPYFPLPALFLRFCFCYAIFFIYWCLN